MASKFVKSIEYSYATSDNAKKFGYYEKGCYTIYVGLSGKEEPISGHKDFDSALEVAAKLNMDWSVGFKRTYPESAKNYKFVDKSPKIIPFHEFQQKEREKNPDKKSKLIHGLKWSNPNDGREIIVYQAENESALVIKISRPIDKSSSTMLDFKLSLEASQILGHALLMQCDNINKHINSK